MGFFGELLRMAPQAYNAYQQGQTAGERERQEAQERARDRKARERQQMLEMALLDLKLKDAKTPKQPTFKVDTGPISTEVGSLDEAQQILERFPQQQKAPEIGLGATDFQEYMRRLEETERLKNRVNPPAATQPPIIGLGARDEATWMRRMEMQNEAKPPSGAASEKERVAAFFLPGAERAVQVIDEVGAKGVELGGLDRAPLVGNFLMNDDEQRMLQAAMTLHDAYLRLTTGATINEGELKQAAMQYIPLKGDKPAVRVEKQRRRAEIIEAIRGLGARALPAGGTQPQPTGGLTPEEAAMDPPDLWEHLVHVKGMSKEEATRMVQSR